MDNNILDVLKENKVNLLYALINDVDKLKQLDGIDLRESVLFYVVKVAEKLKELSKN